MSAAYKKNTEANTKVYDLNQKTMLALDRLACVYATVEEAWANLENEKNSEGDILYAEACGAMDELARAQQHQARCQGEVKRCCESLVRDLSNFRARLEVACDDLADAGMKTIDLQKKADDAHDGTCSHRDSCRRATEELETAGRRGPQQWPGVFRRSRERYGKCHSCSFMRSARQGQQR